MKALLPILLCGCVLLIDGPAVGEDEPPADCEDAMTQMDMNLCAARDYEEADEALNLQWKDTRAVMAKWDMELKDVGTATGGEEALLKAQRAWIAYRDGHCEAEGFAARGGTLEPLLVSTCLADMTRRRTEELKALAESIGQ